MGDSEEEVFRNLADNAGNVVGMGEVEARKIFGDEGFEALRDQMALNSELEVASQMGGIDWMKSRTSLNNAIAGSIVWITLVGTVLAAFFAFR